MMFIVSYAFSEYDSRACITTLSHWLSLLTENLQLTIIFITEKWNANASKVLSTCADPVNCAAVLGKIECIFKMDIP